MQVNVRLSGWRYFDCLWSPTACTLASPTGRHIIMTRMSTCTCNLTPHALHITCISLKSH